MHFPYFKQNSHIHFHLHLPRKCCQDLSLNDDPFWKGVVARDAEEPFEMKGNVSQSAGQLAGLQELCSLKHRLSHVKPHTFSNLLASCCVAAVEVQKLQMLLVWGTRVHEPVSPLCCPVPGWSQRGASGTGTLRKPLCGTDNKGRTVIKPEIAAVSSSL